MLSPETSGAVGTPRPTYFQGSAFMRTISLACVGLKNLAIKLIIPYFYGRTVNVPPLFAGWRAKNVIGNW
jgi:hypothetical protein